VRTFADWSAAMVSDFGEAIRPHLDAIWQEAQKLPDELFDERPQAWRRRRPSTDEGLSQRSQSVKTPP
jgi:hypothetical protein